MKAAFIFFRTEGKLLYYGENNYYFYVFYHDSKGLVVLNFKYWISNENLLKPNENKIIVLKNIW